MKKSAKKKRKQAKKPGPQKQRPEQSVEKSPGQSSDQPQTPAKSNAWMIAATVLVVSAVLLYFWFKPVSSETLLTQVQSDHDAGLHGLVLDGVDTLLQRRAATTHTLLLGADSAERLRHFDRAVEFLSEVADRDDKFAAVEASLRSGELMFDMGRARESEQFLRRALELDPAHPRANQRLAYLLNVLGRRYESSPYAFEALKHDLLDVSQLVLFSDRKPAMKVDDAIEFFRQTVPDDSSTRLPEARQLVFDEKPDEAIPILKKIVNADANNLEANIFLGRAYWSKAEADDFGHWYRNANAQLKSHPDFWLQVGDWADAHQQPRVAARAYWEALKRDPDISFANYRLSELLQKDTFADPRYSAAADRFKERTDILAELISQVSEIMKNPEKLSADEHEQNFRDAAKHLESLGRKWEAYRWASGFLKISPEAEWALAQCNRLHATISNTSERYVGTRFPADTIDLSDFPLPVFPEGSAAPEPPAEESNILFTEVAADAGIDFTFFNATAGDERALYMYQLQGASIGVVDLDVDGLPDMYFPQGCSWPIDPQQNEFFDVLYRNAGDGTFDDITAAAGVNQNGYGCSVAAGDYDSDGFPDLYIGNLGRNRLLRNNGDGSFSDITTESGIDLEEWTTGAVIADFNGDQQPDIYDVNYLTGSDVYTKTCNGEDGLAISCPPRDFQKAPDRIWINQGDGRFIETSEQSHVPPGKGLGIIACDLDSNGKLDMFISNDGEANHLLINESADEPASDIPTFSEMAAAMGADLDNSGVAQACMGIAVLDLNRDRKIDFFVTNFSNEYNVLYQSDDFGFNDASRRANVSVPGFAFIGFGTQAIDAELDGDEDLLITNGGVQDYKDPDKPFEMPALFLENLGKGRFEERREERVGKYFNRPQVGRGMARLDWNRDGLEEVVIGNLGLPAALLRNDSQPAGSFVSIRLIGRSSSRDAIGANVTIQDSGRTQFRQLVAGDGYGASNQRELIFGVEGETVESITIQWPSGEQQTHIATPTNAHYIAVEAHEQLYSTN